LKFPNNPDLVLVDTEIIAQAPLRFLVAGMGDAIATKFEARACAQSGAKNVHGHRSTEAGLVLADFTYEVIREHGIGAKLAVERKVVTPALEKVVEANILLSGLGWENGGVAVAHGFHGALTVIQRSHGAYHGEKVAFGVLVQMVMEGRPTEEVRDLLNFYRQIGLPTRLADLGVSNPTDEELADVAERMCLPGALSHNMPFAIDKKMVKNAIIIADQMGDSLLA
jgi:glycerol dehydrogenase